MFPNEFSSSSVWQFVGVYDAELPCTWWTTVRPSLTSSVVSIYVPPVVVSSWCCITVSARSAVGPSLLLVRCPGTHYRTVSASRRVTSYVLLRGRLFTVERWAAGKGKCGVRERKGKKRGRGKEESWNRAVNWLRPALCAGQCRTRCSAVSSAHYNVNKLWVYCMLCCSRTADFVELWRSVWLRCSRLKIFLTEICSRRRFLSSLYSRSSYR